MKNCFAVSSVEALHLRERCNKLKEEIKDRQMQIISLEMRLEDLNFIKNLQNDTRQQMEKVIERLVKIIDDFR